MALIQAALAGLVALIITPGLLFYFDVTPKVVVLLAGVALLLLGSTARAPMTLTLLLVAALLSLAASTAASANPFLSLFGTNWRRYGAVVQMALLVFAWTVASHPERARTLLRGISLTAVAAAFYGIAQYFGWDPLVPAAQYHIGEGVWTIVRPPGTMGYVSYFATWLLMASFLSFGLASLERGGWRTLGWATGILSLVAMWLTGTRAALLGLLAGVAVWLLVSGFRVTRRVAAAALVIAAAAAVFYFSPAGWPMRSRARWFAEDRWGGARPLLWRDSLRMGIARPVLGHGPEMFTAAFPRYESKELARAYPDFAHESPHNIFLDALVGQGIPGLAILVGVCGAALWWAWRSGKPWLAGALAAGIASQQFTVFTVPTSMLFFACVGLAASSRTAPASERSYERWFFVPVAILLVWVAVRYAMADRSLELARRSLRGGDLRAASIHYAVYDRRRLPGTSADLWYSQALAAVKTPAAQVLSGAAALRATRTSEEPFNAWYNLAVLSASRNDAAGTENALRAAIAAHPKWFKPHWTLAQVLRFQSRLEEAESEASLAEELNAGKNPEVAHTLQEIQELRGERFHK